MILLGPTLFQYDFLLEAVCEENDDKGTIKTLSDKTLTYTPSNGWAKEDPHSFSNVLKEKGAVAAEKGAPQRMAVVSSEDSNRWH